jgi:hypothetical protein
MTTDHYLYGHEVPDAAFLTVIGVFGALAAVAVVMIGNLLRFHIQLCLSKDQFTCA